MTATTTEASSRDADDATAATAGAPPQPPAWRPPQRPPAEPVARPGRLLLLALAGAVALDLGIRGGVSNLMVTLGLAVAAAIVLAQPRLAASARGCAACAVVPTAFLAVWDSAWLAQANLLAAGSLLTAAALYARSGSVADTTIGDLALRAGRAIERIALRFEPLVAAIPRPQSGSARRATRSLEAVALTLPLLILLVALLASADAVFARIVTPQVAPGPLIGHVVLVVMFLLGLLAGALGVGVDSDRPEQRGRFGPTEITLVLGLLAGVLALFVISQAVALTGAGERLVSEAGLTPAEYARSGFFQLCWASVVVLAYLALARRLATAGTYAATRVRALTGLVPLLAVGLVVVSLRRMALYDQAFGLTMLRLAVVAASIWIGCVLLMTAARGLGLQAERAWVPAGALVVALALLLVADLGNPEAFVVRHNVARAASGATIDAVYLRRLSADAVPAILAATDTATAPALRSQLREAVDCEQATEGVARLNLSVRRAEASIAAACPA